METKQCMKIERYMLLRSGLYMIKESYSRVNESKQQLNSFIIYNLDSIERVNDNLQSKNLKKKKMRVEKNAPPSLDLAPFERPIAV